MQKCRTLRAACFALHRTSPKWSNEKSPDPAPGRKRPPIPPPKIGPAPSLRNDKTSAIEPFPRLWTASTSAVDPFPRLRTTPTSAVDPFPRLRTTPTSAVDPFPRLWTTPTSAVDPFPRLRTTSTSAVDSFPRLLPGEIFNFPKETTKSRLEISKFPIIGSHRNRRFPTIGNIRCHDGGRLREG